MKIVSIKNIGGGPHVDPFFLLSKNSHLSEHSETDYIPRQKRKRFYVFASIGRGQRAFNTRASYTKIRNKIFFSLIPTLHQLQNFKFMRFSLVFLMKKSNNFSI